MNFEIEEIFVAIIYILIAIGILDIIINEWIPKMIKKTKKIIIWFKQFNYTMAIMRILRQNGTMHTAELLINGSIETLFAQFIFFYEKYHRRFHPIKEVMAPYWKGDIWDAMSKQQRQQYINRLNDMESAYTIINETYTYLTVTRQANLELLESILSEMFEECNFTSDISDVVSTIKHFKLKWHFSEFNHLIIDEKKICKNNCLDCLKIQNNIETIDSIVAQKIINIRNFLVN